jgi:segregation and condensation protein B
MSEIPEKRNIAEALILASPDPLSAARLAKLIPRCTPAKARTLVEELNADYVAQERAFEICEVAGGYQVRTHPKFASYLQNLQKTRALRLSNAALETLSIVAYKQPITRAEVEHVRGVDAGPVMRSLLERKLVKLDGHREVPGRPMLYATTKRFLEVFSLADLGDLPTLRELEELVAESAGGDSTEEVEPVEGGESTGGAAAEVDLEESAELDATPDADISLEDVEIEGEPN